MYLNQTSFCTDLNIEEYGRIVKKNLKDFQLIDRYDGIPEAKKFPQKGR
jgi:hypothetical protein